ncbi:hypothetical protein J6590_001897 [Homalodisca vitripennis]|nr:hypothetical protein J6590_001897 [Homalodisca vitripennis]
MPHGVVHSRSSSCSTSLALGQMAQTAGGKVKVRGRQSPPDWLITLLCGDIAVNRSNLEIVVFRVSLASLWLEELRTFVIHGCPIRRSFVTHNPFFSSP